MNNLLIRSIVTVICIVYASSFVDYIALALYVLLALTLSFLIDLNKNYIGITIFILFFISTLFYKDLVFVYPIIIQSFSRFEKNRLFLLIIPIIIMLVLKNLDLLILSIALLAFLASKYADKYNEYKNIVYEIDDTYKLKLKNKQIEEEKLIIENSKDIEIAILSERNRIAREIHDSVGHTISGAIIQTEAMRDESNSILNDQIVALQKNLKSGMADIRKSLHSLHDESINLDLSIREIIKNNPSIEFDYSYQVNSEFTYQVKHNIILIVKEAVSNCIKHSDSDKMKIHIIEMPKHLSFSIKDSGKTAENVDKSQGKEKEIEKGLGFVSFNEFAKKHNGRFTYDFEDGLKLMFLLDKETLV